MRCANCRSYIPEGLSEPIQCPTCGKPAKPQEPTWGTAKSGTSSDEPKLKVSPNAESEATPPPLPSESIPSSTAFAPFFTITMPLFFGLAQQLAEPTEGSVSFGPEGFSIVSQNGSHWDKIYYRDLGQVTVVGDSVHLVVRDVESKLTLFHPWLPGFLRGPRRGRAYNFVEMLGRVKRGLTPNEISMYQRRFQ